MLNRLNHFNFIATAAAAFNQAVLNGYATFISLNTQITSGLYPYFARPGND